MYDYFVQLRSKLYFKPFLRTEGSPLCTLAVESTQLLYKIDRVFFKLYDELLRKRGLYTHDLLTMDSVQHISKEVAAMHGPYYKYRVMQKRYDDLSGQLLIWNDNVAHIAFEQPYFGTIIRNKAIAGVMRALFNTAWEGAEETQVITK